MFFFHSKVNLSLKKESTQSLTYSDGEAYIAKNAVDGTIATCMRTKEIGVNSLEKMVWWKVDLGGVYNIYSITILFRNYDGFGIRFFFLYWYTILILLFYEKKV